MTSKKNKKNSPRKEQLLSLLPVEIFFLILLGIYLHNLTHDVYSGDIGDLVTAAYVFGVPHPPGYPLFSLLGGILSHIPFPFPVVTRVGLISALFSWAGLVIYYCFSKYVTKSTILSLLSTSILAFSYYFWIQAEIPEVFALNSFFVIILLALSIMFYFERKDSYLYAFLFTASLSLTHHQIILFLFPGLAILFLRHFLYIFSARKRVLLGVASFLLGLLPYLYIPIAASFHPLINWDQASTLPNFLHLLLRQDYGGFAPGIVTPISPYAKLIVVQSYFKSLLTTFSYQGLFLAVVGGVYLLKKYPLLFLSLFLCFVLTGPFFIYYGSTYYTTAAAFGIIERFYTMSQIVVAFSIIYGLYCLYQLLMKRFRYSFSPLILLCYFFIVPLLLIYYNFPKTDLSHTQIGNTLAKDILNSLPPNAVLFTTGDTKTFNTWYVHYVLGVRPDIELINPPGVGSNVFLDDAITAYKQHHPQTKLPDIVTATLGEVSKNRQIFATYELPYRPTGYLLVPKGLVYELIKTTSVPDKSAYLTEVEPKLLQMHRTRLDTLKPSEMNLITMEIPLMYSNALVEVGNYLIDHYNDPAQSEHYYRRALWYDPDNPSANAGLSLSLYKAYNDCTNALPAMKEAIKIYPIWQAYYAQLYIMSSECHAPVEQISSLKNDYQKFFRGNIESDPLVVIWKENKLKAKH